MNGYLLTFGIFAGLVTVWGFLRPRALLDCFWPVPDPSEGGDAACRRLSTDPQACDHAPSPTGGGAPEPRFAWRQKMWGGGQVVSPLFHSPVAAGRWVAENRLLTRVTFVEVVDGIPCSADPQDTARAIFEACERCRETV